MFPAPRTWWRLRLEGRNIGACVDRQSRATPPHIWGRISELQCMERIWGWLISRGATELTIKGVRFGLEIQTTISPCMVGVPLSGKACIWREGAAHLPPRVTGIQDRGLI